MLNSVFHKIHGKCPFHLFIQCGILICSLPLVDEFTLRVLFLHSIRRIISRIMVQTDIQKKKPRKAISAMWPLSLPIFQKASKERCSSILCSISLELQLCCLKNAIFACFYALWNQKQNIYSPVAISSACSRLHEGQLRQEN